MANTITKTTNFGSATSRRVIRTIVVESDGTELADEVLFDHSAFANGTKYASVEKVQVFGSCEDTGATEPTIIIEFKATANDPIAAGSLKQGFCADHTKISGFRNPVSSGANGDIVATTTNTTSGDKYTIVLHLKQRGL